LNRVTRIFEPRWLAAAHDVARWAASATPPTGHERRYPTVTAGPKASHRRSRPILHCHTPHAHGPRETDSRRPTNGVTAVPRPHARTSPSPRAVLRPCRGPYRDLVTLTRKEASLTALRTAIKAATSYPRVSTEPPPPAIGIPSVSHCSAQHQCRLSMPSTSSCTT
jgi:hypothetical protein